VGKTDFRTFNNDNKLFLNTFNPKTKNYLSPGKCPDFRPFFCCGFTPGEVLKGI